MRPDHGDLLPRTTRHDEDPADPVGRTARTGAGEGSSMPAHGPQRGRRGGAHGFVRRAAGRIGPIHERSRGAGARIREDPGGSMRGAREGDAVAAWVHGRRASGARCERKIGAAGRSPDRPPAGPPASRIWRAWTVAAPEAPRWRGPARPPPPPVAAYLAAHGSIDATPPEVASKSIQSYCAEPEPEPEPEPDPDQRTGACRRI